LKGRERAKKEVEAYNQLIKQRRNEEIQRRRQISSRRKSKLSKKEETSKEEAKRRRSICATLNGHSAVPFSKDDRRFTSTVQGAHHQPHRPPH